MYFYCRHKLDYFNKFKNKEYLENDFEQSELYTYPEFSMAYKWMRNQMRKRIKKGYDGKSMMWLWTQLPKERQEEDYGEEEKDTTYVVLKVNIPRENVLISDFIAWHCVLYDAPLTQYEDEIINKRMSWKRIFDLKWLKDNCQHYTDVSKIQAVTGKIPMKNVEVVRIENFKNKSKERRD